MKTNLKDILESIPDFEDFLKLANEIGELSFKKMQWDNDIKAKEADIVRTVTSNSVYWTNDKVPSMQFIDSTYKHTGLNGELIQMREALADITAQLEKRKLVLSIYRDMLEVWRTMSANERSQNI